MADSSVAITAGSGVAIDARTTTTSGDFRQVVVLGDPATDADVAPVDATLGLSVNLTAGTAAFGKLSANSGVDIGDVDVTTIIPGTAGTNLGKAEDAGHTSGDVGVMMLGVRNDSSVALTGTDLDYSPIATTNTGKVMTATVGLIPHDIADTVDPVKIGGRADTTFQTAVADGDMTDALFDVYGVQEVRTDHPNKWSFHSDGSSALTDQAVEADPGDGLSIYVTDIVFSSGAATAINLFFEEGASKVLGPYYLEAILGRGVSISFNTPKKITASTALTATTSAAIAQSLDVSGFIAP